jgi:hypothetical protein
MSRSAAAMKWSIARGSPAKVGRKVAAMSRASGLIAAVPFEVGEVRFGGPSGVAVEEDDAEPASVR